MSRGLIVDIIVSFLCVFRWQFDSIILVKLTLFPKRYFFCLLSTERATDSNLPSEDWALFIEICDIINDTEDGLVLYILLCCLCDVAVKILDQCSLPRWIKSKPLFMLRKEYLTPGQNIITKLHQKSFLRIKKLLLIY